eukprot:TRINITY_DN2582_c0_g1_i1.p1 TRINITY_DN2582_c0_g1~~TRINITY_DN2582_c0_g1_i1.p1  ORF type:complete len:262 (+),score=94.36 TRINITY_DN2582_c0_g1_i1:183-968(+)
MAVITIPELDFPTPFLSVGMYLVGIFALYQYCKDRKPLLTTGTLKKLLALHNFVLCALSAVMAAGMGWAILRVYMQHGAERAYCGLTAEAAETDSGVSAVWFWLNVFWISKWYELLDTVFIVVSGKRPIFLHVWHHAWVLVVPWYALKVDLFFAWITMFNNSAVHIWMYYYYAIRSLGRDVWWRKYITQVQIVQFAIDALTSLPFVYYKLAGVPCGGNWEAWLLGNFVGGSFFLLFIKFYIDSYREKSRSKTASAARLKEQ